jgi:predicted CoA-binding protein
MHSGIKKYRDFVNEAKKAPGEKKAKATKLVEEIVKMLKANPTVEMSNNWPTEKYAYTLAGIKKYMKDKDYSITEVDDAMYRIANEKELKDVKEEIDYVDIEVVAYDEEYPYYFIEGDKDKYAIIEYYEGLQKDTKAKLAAKKAEAAKAIAGKKKEAEAVKVEKKTKAAAKKAAPKKEGEEAKKKAPAKKAAAKKTAPRKK